MIGLLVQRKWKKCNFTFDSHK